MTRPIGKSEWQPTSWQSSVATQQPTYPDKERVDQVLSVLSRFPPLVTSWEIEKLKARIAAAQRGEAFILQGGDCAESFNDCSSDKITNNLKILLQMSLVLLYGFKKPIVRIGRMAGQYAKPRSADTETVDGVTLPSYRGDLINRSPFEEWARTPDPELMLRGYKHAALTLNFVRALIDGGFADLHHPEYWNLDFVKHSPQAAEYRRIVDAISESVDFMETVSGQRVHEAGRVDFYTSHEGLHLHYEQAQTRFLAHQNGWYNLATHYPWIGMRTAALDGAHVEYFRGIRNPIAIKVGASMTNEWLQGLLSVLNPDNEPGRITLIHRFGARQIADGLPRLIDAVRSVGATVLWTCDPMHGNTESTSDGRKTRKVNNIASELEQAFKIHNENGSRLGGVHFELTGENVTECVGGARGLTEADLARAYHSQVDPRLNYEQALELTLRMIGQTGLPKDQTAK